MRLNYDAQLKTLRNELLQMGTLVEAAIAQATRALLENDLAAAEQAIAADDIIDNKEKEIEGLCLKLIMQQQPVAKDLRHISATLKIIADLERIGDHAQDIAHIVKETDLNNSLGALPIEDMAQSTIDMLDHCLSSYIGLDEQMARAVIDEDDIIDDYFEQIQSGIIKLIQAEQCHAESAVYLLMIAKYLERIGDHATNIAEWVIYSVTGKHLKEHE